MDTMPNEILKTLSRLTAASDAAWAMAVRAREKGNDKSEADALRLAKDTAKEITDIVTNNKPLIDAAYEVADQDKEEQQRQMSNSKASQEHHKKEESIV